MIIIPNGSLDNINDDEIDPVVILTSDMTEVDTCIKNEDNN